MTPHQGELFTVTPNRGDGESLKADGIAKVLSNAEWQHAVTNVIAWLTHGDIFTVEDLRIACAQRGIPEPAHYNSWGAIMNIAAKDNLIESVGWRTNHISSAHARMVRVWRGVRRRTD